MQTKGPRCQKCGKRFENRSLRDAHHEKCESKEFQLIACGHFGNDPTIDDTTSCYIICTHILLKGAAVRETELATERHSGTVICELPYDHEEHDVEGLRAVCSSCARQNGLIPAA